MCKMLGRLAMGDAPIKFNMCYMTLTSSGNIELNKKRDVQLIHVLLLISEYRDDGGTGRPGV